MNQIALFELSCSWYKIFKFQKIVRFRGTQHLWFFSTYLIDRHRDGAFSRFSHLRHQPKWSHLYVLCSEVVWSQSRHESHYSFAWCQRHFSQVPSCRRFLFLVGTEECHFYSRDYCWNRARINRELSAESSIDFSTFPKMSTSHVCLYLLSILSLVKYWKALTKISIDIYTVWHLTASAKFMILHRFSKYYNFSILMTVRLNVSLSSAQK